MIFSADIHARASKPKSRKDNYLESQDRKLRFLCQLAQESPPWFVSGDLLDKANSNQWLEQYLINLFKEYQVKPIICLGQHDLVNHSIELFNESSIAVLQSAGVVEVLKNDYWSDDRYSVFGVSYGIEEYSGSFLKSDKKLKILLWHKMVIKDDTLWNKQIANTGEKILRKYPMFDIICTGDNHNTFLCQNKNRFLVNPGSMMRLKTNQKDHKPCVFRWDKGNLEQIFLPIEEDVFDDSHITEKEEKESRLDGFITKLNEIRPELNENSSVSFKGNLKNFFQANPETREVEEITWQCVPKDRK